MIFTETMYSRTFSTGPDMGSCVLRLGKGPVMQNVSPEIKQAGPI